MAETLKVGVMGCGNISTTYLRLVPLFRGLEIVACADLDENAAMVRAGEFKIEAMTPKALITSNDIDIILNLTIPSAHQAVSLSAVRAGKHVYSEKPLAIDLAQGKALAKAAKEHKVKVACAPDTFLGAACQDARQALDAGAVGKITAGTAAVMSHGMEAWHPSPDFFFKAGAGPILDMGPYYLGFLINLLGPVTRVAALTNIAEKTRIISSEPRKGEKIHVKTPTNIQALLHFANGATVSLLASWDVWAHRHTHMELYGTQGSIFLPDPNFFGGTVEMTQKGEAAKKLPDCGNPLGIPNDRHGEVVFANYRGIGLADLADAIHHRRDARCSIERALHAVDIMTAILESGETGAFIDLTTSCTRPKPLDAEQAQALMRPAS